MKKALILALFLPFISVSQSVEDAILTLTEFKIKTGHTAQFEDGIKKWKDCYNDNGGDSSWGFWSRVQGEGNVYIVTNFIENWATMDYSEQHNDSCSVIVSDYIMPYVESTTYNITCTIPEWSKENFEGDTKIVWSTFIRVKDKRAFGEVMKEITSVTSENYGELKGIWYKFKGGDKDEAHYMISEHFENYTDLGNYIEGPFEMYAKIKGEKKANDLLDKWNNSLENSWSYIWEHNMELSNYPE